jgi:hypothetical protein
MKILRILFGIVLSAVVFASLPVTHGSQANLEEQKLPEEKTMNGLLLNVDTRARLISMRGHDQKETIFNYSDDLQVVSPDRTIQGLTGKPGAQVRIRYREDRGIKLATRIELLEKP